MGHMTLPKIFIVYEDLKKGRPAAANEPSRRSMLELTLIGAVYLGRIDDVYERLAGLPSGLTGREPFAAEMARVNDHHDSLGRAIASFCDTVAHAPGLDETLKTSAETIRTTFVPSRATLNRSYVTEASEGDATEDHLAALESQLRLFPIPGNPGATLYDWVAAFAAAKHEMAALLSSRADTKFELRAEDRSAAVTLFNEARGLLSRCRAALEDEAAGRTDLPAGLVARIFALYDELNAA